MRIHRSLLASIGAVGLGIAMAGCGSSQPTAAGGVQATSTPAAGSAVAIATFKFAPASLEVPRGTTVRWRNEDQILHTVSAGVPGQKSGLFDERLADVGATTSHAFNDLGAFPYFCDIHQFMTGEVIVR